MIPGSLISLSRASITTFDITSTARGMILDCAATTHLARTIIVAFQFRVAPFQSGVGASLCHRSPNPPEISALLDANQPYTFPACSDLTRNTLFTTCDNSKANVVSLIFMSNLLRKPRQP